MKNKMKLFLVSVFVFGVTGVFAEVGQGEMINKVSFMKLIDECSKGKKKSCENLKQQVQEMKKRTKHNKNITKSRSKNAMSANMMKNHPMGKMMYHRSEIILKEVQSVDNNFTKQLKKLRKQSPDKFHKIISSTSMGRYTGRKGEEEQAKKDLVSHIKLNLEQYEIIEGYKNTKDEKQKDKLRQELIYVLSKQFDLRNKDIESKIQVMKDKVSGIERDLAKRRENKKRIVENRADMILGRLLNVVW